MKQPFLENEKAAGKPKTDEERLKSHFGADWKNHSVDELPKRGSGLKKSQPFLGDGEHFLRGAGFSDGGALVKSGGVEEKIVEFFRENPNPPDDKLHAFAEKIGMEPDDLEGKVYELVSTFLTGGKSKGKSTVKPDNKELKAGVKVEMEHLDPKSPFARFMAAKIAMDHLEEDKKYYTKLAVMESKEKKK